MKFRMESASFFRKKKMFQCPACNRYRAEQASDWGKPKFSCGFCGATSTIVKTIPIYEGTFPFRKKVGEEYEFEIERIDKAEIRGQNWSKIRREVLERDKHKCKKCGNRENLHVHHKTPIAQGGKNEMRNLVTLCRECHAKEHDEAKGLILSAGNRKE